MLCLTRAKYAESLVVAAALTLAVAVAQAAVLALFNVSAQYSLSEGSNTELRSSPH